MPLKITALNSGGMDVIGLGRPMCVDIEIFKRLLERQADVAPSYESALPVDPREIAGGATDAEAKALEM